MTELYDCEMVRLNTRAMFAFSYLAVSALCRPGSLTPHMVVALRWFLTPPAPEQQSVCPLHDLPLLYIPIDVPQMAAQLTPHDHTQLGPAAWGTGHSSDTPTENEESESETPRVDRIADYLEDDASDPHEEGGPPNFPDPAVE